MDNYNDYVNDYMNSYNCPDCNEAKLQSEKNARKINEVIEQVNRLIQVNNETVDFIEEVAELKVNEVLGNVGGMGGNLVTRDVVAGEIFTIGSIDTPTTPDEPDPDPDPEPDPEPDPDPDPDPDPEPEEPEEPSIIVSDYYKQWNNITAVTTAGIDDDIIRDNKDFTIFAKIENPTDESNPAFDIINNWSVDGGQAYQFQKNWQGKIIFRALGESGNILLQTSETFSNKGVSFISCVRSGLSLTIYVNNVEKASTTIASNFVFKDTQDVIKLGHTSKTLHTLLYYNRALTQEELTKNYNALGGV